MTADVDLSYPIGRFETPPHVTAESRRQAVDAIDELPSRMREAVANLSDAQLDLPYRPGGWTVRQLVHHVADSHMNAYIRLKLAVTEDRPTIKPYDQNLWAELSDMRLPVAISLSLLDGIHARWSVLCRSLTPEQFLRTFHHPEIGEVTIDTHLQMYAWHSRHHVAHVTSMRTRMGI
jgi:uncharacterized damage-inducible protein DinB